MRIPLFALSFACLALMLSGCSFHSTPAATQASEQPLVVTATPAIISAPVSPTPQALQTSAPTPVAGTTDKPLAARVNGQPIPLALYEREVAQFEAAMLGQGTDLSTQEGQAAFAAMRRQVLDALIDQILIEQAAEQQGLILSDDELEKKVQESIAAGGGQEKFNEWLEASHLTAEDFRRMLRSQLITEAVIERVVGELPTVAEQVHIRHILVFDRATAEEILAKLKSGADFAALAAEYSQGPTAKQGGDLGWFPRGLLISRAVEDAAFSLMPGAISEVVADEFSGYHIIQTLERAERPLTTEMIQQIKQQRFMSWLLEQREAATIEIFISLQEPAS